MNAYNNEAKKKNYLFVLRYIALEDGVIKDK
jgi:hypothetical protein